MKTPLLTQVNRAIALLFPLATKCLIQIWILTCIMFVFLALLEYAVILYLKNMKGTHKTFVRSEVLAITKIPAVDANWANQQGRIRSNLPNCAAAAGVGTKHGLH